MKQLTFLEIETVNGADLRCHRNRGLHNYTRFYKFLRVVGQDVEVHTVAALARRNGRMVFKEVVRATVDSKRFWVKDLALGIMSGYQVDWSPEKVSRPRAWSYDGKWATEAYNPRSNKWHIRCWVVNPEVLKESERFRYCAWNQDCGDILHYLKAYLDHPRLELLAKAGASHFCDRIGFVRSLEKDKGLLQFFMANLSEILKKFNSIPEILMAYRRGISLGEARIRMDDRRAFRKLYLPAHIDPSRAMRYIRAGNCTNAWVYSRYLEDCLKVGLDLKDTKTAFPNRFQQRATIVFARVELIRRLERAKHDQEERRRLAEESRERDLAILKMAKRYVRLEKRRTRTFMAQIPRNEAEFVREGKHLHNCLGESYATKMANGETVLVWIRRAEAPKKAFVAVEFEPKTRKVLQCYGDKNSKPARPVFDFVNRVLLKRAS